MGTSQVLLTSSHSAIFDSIQVFSSKAQPLTMYKNPFLQIVPQRIVFVIGSHRILLDPIRKIRLKLIQKVFGYSHSHKQKVAPAAWPGL